MATGTTLKRLEVWSDFECASGTRLRFFTPLPSSALRDRVLNGEDTFTVQVHRDVDAWTYVAQDRVLRAVLTDGTLHEYRIASIGEAHEADGRLVAEITCESPLYDLGGDLVGHALANSDVLHDFPLTALTPTELLNVFLGNTAGFTSPAAAAWWTLGTVDFTDRVDINLKGFTALEAIRELQKVLSSAGTPSELEIVRSGTSAYVLHLRTVVGAPAETAYLRFNRNLHSVKRLEAAAEQPTRVYPFGQDLDGVRFDIGGATWEVDTVSSNDVALLGSPVAFDDQFNTLYLERADGTKIQINDTVLSTQVLALASAPGLSPGDRIWVRKNAAGDELTYLDRPSTTRVRAEPLDRPDIPPVDNLVPNAFLNTWAAGLPVGWAKIGAPTVTEVSEGGKVLNGSRSAQLVCLAEEEGLETDWIDITPKEGGEHFLGQWALFPIEGVWRVEMLAEDGVPVQLTIPDGVGDGARAYTDIVNAWVERISVQDQAVNFFELGIVRVKLRIIADRLDSGSGQASCYFDSGQLVQTPLPDLPFYDGYASQALWKAANERLLHVDDGAFQIEVGTTDLFRIDVDTFQYDELVLGGTVEVQDPKLALVAETRIRRIREELMVAGATDVELSDEPAELVDITRLPNERRPGTLLPRGGSAGGVDGSPILDEDYSALYLEPRRFAGAKSIGYYVSASVIDDATLLANETVSNDAGPILVHTFSVDREKRYVSVVYYPATGGAGKAGVIHHLTPWTFYSRDNRPTIKHQVYPAPLPSQVRVGFTIVDDGDQVAGYVRSYDEGDTPPAFTRNPSSGYVTDPHEFSVDFDKPTESDPDVIVEAYGEDDEGNVSHTLPLRVTPHMVVPVVALNTVNVRWVPGQATTGSPPLPYTLFKLMADYQQAFASVLSVDWSAVSATHGPVTGSDDITSDDQAFLFQVGLFATWPSDEAITITFTPYDAIGGSGGSGAAGNPVTRAIEAWGETGSAGARSQDEDNPSVIAFSDYDIVGAGLTMDYDANGRLRKSLFYTASTSSPSGTPKDGQLWFKYS